MRETEDERGRAVASSGGEDQERAAEPSLTIRLLGDFQVSIAARTIPARAWRLRKARTLLQLLALAPGGRLTRDELCDRLWPELPAASAAHNLYSTLHVLRRVLAPVAPLLLRDGAVTLVTRGSLTIDVWRYVTAATLAQRSDTRAEYETALRYYTGDLLPDSWEDLAINQHREQLRQTYHTLLIGLAGVLERQGAWADAVAALQTLLDSDPASEAAHVELMRLYAAAGQRGVALQQYQRLRAALAEAYAAEPEQAARDLYRDLRAAGDAQRDAPESSRHNLPASLTSFVGRERELAELRTLLRGRTETLPDRVAEDKSDRGVARSVAPPRLVTLDGVGGSGKTRLALALAHELRSDYPDGVWLVEFAAIVDPALVVGTMMSALGLREELGVAAQATLTRTLASKRVLLILDNCEHLREAVADLVGELLLRCPGLTILATSRSRLHLPGEVAWRVPPLSVPPVGQTNDLSALAASPAMALLIERVRARQIGFTLTAQNASDAVEICRRLAGLPLAIELAAARTGVLSLAQLAAQLDDVLLFRFSQMRGREPRQLTIRAALDWSYLLLGAKAQVLFRRIAPFVGGWSLRAAIGVTGFPATTVLDALEELLDHSLIQVEHGDHEARYWLLEPVRQYAAELLTERGEVHEAQTRHAAFFLKLAEEAEQGLLGPDQAAWQARLAPEVANFDAAFGWFASQGPLDHAFRLTAMMYTAATGYWAIYSRWSAILIARQAEVAPDLRARALGHVAGQAWWQGDYPRSIAIQEQALALLRDGDDERGIIAALHHLALATGHLGDRDRSHVLSEEAFHRAEAIDDSRSMTVSLHQLANLARLAGDLDQASVYCRRSLALSQARQDGRWIALATNNLALIDLARGRAIEASRGFLAALRGFHDMGLPWGIAACLDGLACASAAVAPGLAARLFGASEALREALGIPLPPPDRSWYDPGVATLRMQLDPATCAALWVEGRQLSADEAIDAALSLRLPGTDR